MLKHAQENIDPATQQYGTSIDNPGTTKQIKNTPRGVTGPNKHKPHKMHVRPTRLPGSRPSFMARASEGVKVAMTTYVQGFTDRCAACGVDPDVLVKQAINWGAIGKAVAPTAKMLNPLNMVTGIKGLLRGKRRASLVRDHLGAEIQQANTGAGLSGPELHTAVNSSPILTVLRDKNKQHIKNLAGGTASTAALGGTAYGLTRPEPEPQGIGEHINALMAQYFKGR
jgi:hypothetical protein